MKRNFFGWLLLFLLSPSAFGATPFSDSTFKDACQQASTDQKLVFIDFYTTWCGPCKLLDKNTWTDAEVVKLFQSKGDLPENRRRKGRPRWPVNTKSTPILPCCC